MNPGVSKQRVVTPHYGEIYGYNVSDTITITGTGIANKVQLTSFSSNGESGGLITPDHTNDHITIGIAGIYLVVASIVCESTGGVAINAAFNVYTNNGATQFQNLHGHRKLSGAVGDTGSVSISGFASFAISDTIEIWTWNETNTDDVIIDDINLSLYRIGL